jgi:hypothetical protein
MREVGVGERGRPVLRITQRRAAFGPGFWAYSFPFAAAVTYGVHWLAAEHVRSGAALGYALVGLLTTGFVLLAARTVTGLIHGTFLPRVPTPLLCVSPWWLWEQRVCRDAVDSEPCSWAFVAVKGWSSGAF